MSRARYWGTHLYRFGFGLIFLRQPGRMGLSMIDLFCASFGAVPERIVLDIDDTDDAVHGGP